MSYILNKQLNAIYDDLEIVDERSTQNATDIDALEAGVGSLPTIVYNEQTYQQKFTAGTFKASYVLDNLQDGTKLFTSFLPNKQFITIEGEGIEPNDFKFSCGNGSLMSQSFGLFIGVCRITQYYYSVMKYDSNGVENVSGSVVAQFQLFEGGVGRDAYININIPDISVATDVGIKPPTVVLNNHSGFLQNSQGVDIKDVSDSAYYRNGGNIVSGFSFKCISISGCDINTRHRLTLRCETVNGIYSD
jgi:hypothetical protein